MPLPEQPHELVVFEHRALFAAQLPELQISQLPVQSEITSVHVPSEPATLHRLQLPSQEVAQHTPFSQCVESQSPSKVHVCAKDNLALMFLQIPDEYACTLFSVVLYMRNPSVGERASLCAVV